MVLIKYPKFVLTGQDNIAVAGSTTHIAFVQNFDVGNIPVVVACPSTLTDIMVENKTTAGFDVAVAAACTAHWIAIYQSL